VDLSFAKRKQRTHTEIRVARLQAEFQSDWEPTPLQCGWCNKWRYVDDKQHYIEEEWKADGTGIGLTKDARFECYKLCLLVPDQPEMQQGESVGVCCQTPEQECSAPNPAAPRCQQSEEKLAAIREWFIAKDVLDAGCSDEEFEEALGDWFYLYLAGTGDIVPEGMCGNEFIGWASSEDEED
jgi:hypothetical protein